MKRKTTIRAAQRAYKKAEEARKKADRLEMRSESLAAQTLEAVVSDVLAETKLPGYTPVLCCKHHFISDYGTYYNPSQRLVDNVNNRVSSGKLMLEKELYQKVRKVLRDANECDIESIIEGRLQGKVVKVTLYERKEEFDTDCGLETDVISIVGYRLK